MIKIGLYVTAQKYCAPLQIMPVGLHIKLCDFFFQSTVGFAHPYWQKHVLESAWQSKNCHGSLSARQDLRCFLSLA